MNDTPHPASLLTAWFAPDEIEIEDELVAARNAKSSAVYAADARRYHKEFQKHCRKLNAMLDDPTATDEQLIEQYSLTANAEAFAVKNREFSESAREFEKRFSTFDPYNCAPYEQQAIERANQIEPKGLRQWYDSDGYHLEPSR